MTPTIPKLHKAGGQPVKPSGKTEKLGSKRKYFCWKSA